MRYHDDQSIGAPISSGATSRSTISVRGRRPPRDGLVSAREVIQQSVAHDEARKFQAEEIIDHCARNLTDVFGGFLEDMRYVLIERFILTISSECLGKIVPLGERHLRRAVSEYVNHCLRERPHQSFGGRFLDGPANGNVPSGPVRRRQRLGGLLNFYHRDAA